MGLSFVGTTAGTHALTTTDDLIQLGYKKDTIPVDFETYTADEGRIDLTDGTNAHALLVFLLEHRGVGFTPAELHEQVGLPRGSVSPTLARLERVGLVRHKGDYWAAADDDRVAAASAAVLGLGSAAERHRDDWYDQHEGWADELEDLGEDGE